MFNNLIDDEILMPPPNIASRFFNDEKLVVINSDTLTACKELPSEFISLIVTSPPYNLGKVYEAQTSLEEYLNWQEIIITELVRLLKPGGSICWQVGNFVHSGEIFPLDIYFYPMFKKLGLKLRNRIVWHFEHGLHASLRFSGRYETLLWFTKGADYTFNLDSVRVPAKYPGKRHFKGDKQGQLSGNPLGKNPSDFWKFMEDEWECGVLEIPNVKANHPEKTIHPCQFPVELAERCIMAMTNENDWVLDPFAGVGSTLIAAAKNYRRSIAIDRDAEYCSIAKQRAENYFSGNLKLRPIGKPIHAPSGKEKVAQLPIEWLKERRERYRVDGKISGNDTD